MIKSYDSGKKFLIQFNYDYCRERYIATRTIKSALLANTIKIRELALCYGENIIQLWIEAWIVNFSQHMDFSISEAQCKETSISLIEELYMLNLNEITLFFRKLRNGYYGKFYGKFDMQIILIAAINYRKERGMVLSKLTTEQQNKIIQ